MHLSANEGIEGVRFAVTGGQGFVGAALCLELLRRGAREVRSFDLRAVSAWSPQLLDAGVRLIQGDVRNKDEVGRAFRGVDCVFHLASYGMSGKEMVQAGRCDQINISGTCNVLDACHEHGVRRLVYVSRYNVVFGGKPIANGNEELKEVLRTVPEVQELVGKEESRKLLSVKEQDGGIGVRSYLKSAFTKLMTASDEAVSEAIANLKIRLNSESKARSLTTKEQLVLSLEKQYPGDVGVLAAFFLNFVKLNPGEALYVGANEPHAYLSGECIECMATSDNVKHL